MMGAIYAALLLAAVFFIVTRGGKDERVVIIALMVGSLNTYAMYKFFGGSFISLQLPMLANETAVLAILLGVALLSKRFWPIPVSSLQIAAFLSLLTPFFGQNIVSHGLGVVQGIWAYPQLAIIIWGTIRGRRSRGSMTATTATL